MSWFLLNHHRFTKDLTLQKPGYSSTGRNLSDGPKRPDGPWRPWPRIGFPLGTNRMGPMQTMGSCSFSSYNILLAMASNLLIYCKGLYIEACFTGSIQVMRKVRFRCSVRVSMAELGIWLRFPSFRCEQQLHAPSAESPKKCRLRLRYSPIH